MAIFKCKMCGGNLEIQDGMTVCECEYCGSTQTVPTLDDEKKINLFSRANRLRAACEFDKAFGVYESIVTEFQEEAEAYWGLVLCKYGIEYVDDPKTGKKIPTCHRSSFDSVFEDSNFEMVMECSGALSRSVYREEAKAIEELRVGIIEVSSKEEPYDIFICYKETAENGERTLDSVLAQDVYDALTDKGYKVFFSRITLEDKLGQEYEPYIFAALNSAKIMLAFGTNYENYNAVWVKNEWSRFLSLIEKGEKKTLIPCFKDIDAYDMPAEFKRLQAQDLGKVGAIQDLLRGIEKIIGKKNSPVEEAAVKGNNALTRRGYLYLEDKDYQKAEEYFEKALDENPEDGEAYLGKVFIKLRVQNINELKALPIALDIFPDFIKAVRFSTGEQKELLNAILEFNQNNAANGKDLVASILNGNYNNLITLAPVLKQAAGVVDAASMYNVFGVSKTVIDEILYKYEIYCVLEKSGKPLNTKEILESGSVFEKLDIKDMKRLLVELNNAGIIMFVDNHFVLISDEFRASKINAQKNIYRTQIEECEQRISVLNDRKSAIPAEIDEIKMSSDQLAAGAAEEKARIDAEIFRLNQEIADEKKRFKAGCDPDIAERTNLEAHIDNLTKEMSGLGLFQGKRKKELNDQIAFFRQKLSMVESAIYSKQQYFQNFAGDRQNRINELSKTVIKYADPADAIKGLEYELSNIDCEIRDLQNRIAELKLQMEQCDWKPDLIDIDYFDNDSDYKFAMPVNDAFAMTGKGVLVTGCIAVGQIRKRDSAVIIHKDGSTVPTTVINIEKSRQILDSARAGDSVGLLCGGINRNQVAKGDIIAVLSGGGAAGTRVGMNAPVNPSVNTPVNRVYNVELTKSGSAVVKVIKNVREITGLDLKAAKDLVDTAPSVIKKGVSLEEARQIKQLIESDCGDGVLVTIR